MLRYGMESILTLPLLYAIIGTVVEFRFGKLRCRLIIGLAVCATICMDYWFYINTGDLYSHAWISTCVPSFLSLFYLAKYRDGSFFFAYLTECVLASVATSLSYLFSYLLPWQYPLIPVLIHAALLAAMLVVCRCLFFNKVFEAERAQGKRWILYCVMPVLCLVIWALYTGSSARLLDTEHKVNIPYAGYMYPQNIPALFVLLTVIVYMLFLIFMIMRHTHLAELERQEKTALDLQSRALEKRIAEMEEKDENLRILRHDMRHHLSTLSGLMGSREYSQAQEYLRQLDRNLAQVKQESYCSNAVINAVLSSYAVKCKKEDIRFLVQVEISGDLPVDHLDIGAVISNALENALNACRKQSAEAERFINFQCIQHKKQFVLDISNSFSGTVEFDSGGRPVSPQENHGIGSQSIYAFARKYNATTDYSANNSIFSVRIMFTEAV